MQQGHVMEPTQRGRPYCRGDVKLVSECQEGASVQRLGRETAKAGALRWE